MNMSASDLITLSLLLSLLLLCGVVGVLVETQFKPAQRCVDGEFGVVEVESVLAGFGWDRKMG